VTLKNDRIEQVESVKNLKTIQEDDIALEFKKGHKSALSGGGNGTKSNSVITNSAMIKSNKVKKAILSSGSGAPAKNVGLFQAP